MYLYTPTVITSYLEWQYKQLVESPYLSYLQTHRHKIIWKDGMVSAGQSDSGTTLRINGILILEHFCVTAEQNRVWLFMTLITPEVTLSKPCQ